MYINKYTVSNVQFKLCFMTRLRERGRGYLSIYLMEYFVIDKIRYMQIQYKSKKHECKIAQ